MLQTARYLSLNVLITLLLLSACQFVVQPETTSSTTTEEVATEATEEHAEEEAQGDAHEVHWTYSGEEGPEHWGALSEEFGLCATGEEQSPIDLVDAAGENLPDITFNYQPSALNIINNGHTVQVNYDPGSSIEVDGVVYDLLQFHFHSQSEHTIDGASYPLELHLVHSTPEGNLAVVGVMLEAGEENAAFASTWENAPGEASEGMQIDGATVNALDMLPAGGAYYSYGGSLTTPPCSEGVKWHVMTTPVQVSQAQIDAMADILQGNYRPVQPLHDRELAVDTESAPTR